MGEYAEIEAAIRDLLRHESLLIWSFGRTGDRFELQVNREAAGLAQAVQERWGEAMMVRVDARFGFAPNCPPSKQ